MSSSAPNPSPSRAADGVVIRPVATADLDQIWSIFQEVVAAGDTFPFDLNIGRDAALEFWVNRVGACWVAEQGGAVVGSYYLKDNQPGRGAHVCNGGYMVAAVARGQGIGERLCAHSITIARELGYRAMQFNLVVSTNRSAVKLWQRLGFDIVATLPEAFNHAELGMVDALVFYRTL